MRSDLSFAMVDYFIRGPRLSNMVVTTNRAANNISFFVKSAYPPI